MLEAGPILLVDAGLSTPEPDAPQVATALAEAGYMVQSCDVEGALAAVRANTPALVVLDADAPGAMALLVTLRKMEESSRTPVLLVGVAGKTVQSARDAILRGADAFYPRPIDARRVLLKVETYLGLPDEVRAPQKASPPKSAPTLDGLVLPAGVSLPFERDSGPIRPEPTFVLNDAPTEEPSRKKVRTLPEGTIAEPDAPAVATASEMRSGTMPFEAAPPDPAPAAPSFEAGLSDDLRAVLKSMERKLFPDAPPLAVPDIGMGEGDDLVPSDLLAGLDDIGDDDLGDDVPAEPAERPAAPSPSVSVSLVDTVDLRAQTFSPLPPTALAPVAPPPDVERAAPAVPTKRHDSIPPAPPPEVQATSGPRLAIHGRVGSSGDLAREDPVQVFAAALAARTNGALRFRRGRSEKFVTLAAGRPALASSTLVEDRLVEGLYRTGRLPREPYERVRATIAGSGRRAGAVLVELGLLKKDELLPVVRAHLEDVLYSIYGWEEGTWSTEPESDVGADQIRMETPAAAMILEGARLRYGTRRVERLLGGPSTILSLRAAAVASLDDARLLPEERSALEACDGRRTVGEVARAAGATLEVIGPALWALVCLGFLEVSARGMPADVAAPATAATRADLERALERRRVEERLALARVGDYFALLGIARTSGGHEIRRAYLDLSRAFDPARFSEPALSDLMGAAHEILAALDDAYEVLRDGILRDAYRSNLLE